MSSQQFGAMRGYARAPAEEGKGYSSGMIAAFVIVGIIVLAFLVLIILAVTLPARYWGCAEEDKRPVVGNVNPNNVVAAPSPAAVMQTISGMGQVFTEQQRKEHAMRQVQMGPHTAHQMAPLAFRSEPSLRESFVQSANVPVVLNTLGAAQGALAGTVSAASGSPDGTMSAAPSYGHSMLIEAPSTSVSRAPLMSERSMAEMRNPVMGSIVAGLQSDTLTIGAGSTLPQVVSGRANPTAGAQAFQSRGFVVLTMEGCGYCHALEKAVNESKHRDLFVFFDHKSVDSLRESKHHRALKDSFAQVRAQGNYGFPLTFCYHTKDGQVVMGKPVAGFSARGMSAEQAVEKLMQDAKNNCPSE